MQLFEVEIDAARAAGCLVEHEVDHGEWTTNVAFITDVEFAADLAERAVERIEKEAAQRRKEDEEFHARNHGPDPSLTDEQKKEARQAEYKARKKRAAEARARNEEVGINLLKRRGSSSRKEQALNRAKALAMIVLDDNPRLAARGLRLVLTQLQDVQVKQLKTTGESREKVSYAEPEQCHEYLEKRIAEARSVDEVLEHLSDAIVASLLADENELATVKAGARWHLRPRGREAPRGRHQGGASPPPAGQEQLGHRAGRVREAGPSLTASGDSWISGCCGSVLAQTPSRPPPAGRNPASSGPLWRRLDQSTATPQRTDRPAARSAERTRDGAGPVLCLSADLRRCGCADQAPLGSKADPSRRSKAGDEPSPPGLRRTPRWRCRGASIGDRRLRLQRFVALMAAASETRVRLTGIPNGPSKWITPATVIGR